MREKYIAQKDIKNGRIISAVFIRETELSIYLDCEGDLEWFPKSQINFNRDKNELEAPLWLLKEKFPETKF